MNQKTKKMRKILHKPITFSLEFAFKPIITLRDSFARRLLPYFLATNFVVSPLCTFHSSTTCRSSFLSDKPVLPFIYHSLAVPRMTEQAVNTSKHEHTRLLARDKFWGTKDKTAEKVKHFTCSSTFSHLCTVSDHCTLMLCHLLPYSALSRYGRKSQALLH